MSGLLPSAAPKAGRLTPYRASAMPPKSSVSATITGTMSEKAPTAPRRPRSATSVTSTAISVRPSHVGSEKSCSSSAPQPLPRHEHRVHLRDAGAGNDVHQRQPKHRQQRHRRKHAEQSPAAERAEKLPQLLPRHIARAEKGACKGQADAARVPLLLFQIRSPPLFLL